MHKSLYALLGLSSSLIAAQDNCAPEAPTTCYSDGDCNHCYCLGPENIIANAPVCPRTCDGDFSISVAGFYWNAHQDGMEYAIDNSVHNGVPGLELPPLPIDYENAVQEFNTLIDAKYLAPNFKWDWGFKLGLAYCSPCDGWDVGLYWTWYRGRASSHVEAEVDDNHVLLPLWSEFVPQPGLLNYATDIESNWSLELNLIDIELGRDFWASRYLSIRPHVGLRIAFLEQDYNIEHKGGSYGQLPAIGIFLQQNPVSGAQSAQNDEVHLDNDFKGVGVRAGLDSTWNLGCGWAIYGNMAAAIVYGRFNVDHDEWSRFATGNHTKRRLLETDESFRASRAMLDLGLGLQWMAMVCDCKYGLLISLGWEQHLFFHQNQLWRVVRKGDIGTGTQGSPNLINNTGENVYHQRRGDLDTQGVTLKLRFDF